MLVKELDFKPFEKQTPSQFGVIATYEDVENCEHNFTVVDRQTGLRGGVRDVETGYRAPDGKMWIVSGNFDVRNFPRFTVEEAIELIKERANTLKGE